MASILELCQKISGIDNKNGLHIRDIAEKVIILDSSFGTDIDLVMKKVSASLNANTKNKTSLFAKIPNKKGGFKSGVYKLKKQLPKQQSAPLSPDINTQYTGKAGEYAVFSELLYWGFNPAMVTVDDGVDIIASKDRKYFHIQVKTAKEIIGKPYSFNIKKNSFNRYDNYQTYYIFVLRQKTKERYTNDFIIVSNIEMSKIITLNQASDNKDTYSFSLQKIGGIYKLNKSETVIVNDFSFIK